MELVCNSMAAIEERIISAILTRIRRRRDDTSIPISDSHAHFSEAIPPASIRDAQFSDFEAVQELKRRWGLIPDSFENWERLWRHNPALECSQPLPIGWVLEAEGKVVGYLGNIASSYQYGDRTLTAVTGRGFVVEPAHRAVSLVLDAAFYSQNPSTCTSRRLPLESSERWRGYSSRILSRSQTMKYCSGFCSHALSLVM
jgi:hypothetical protein